MRCNPPREDGMALVGGQRMVGTDDMRAVIQLQAQFEFDR